MVGMTGFEPATSCSQSTRATNCATSRNSFSEFNFLLCEFILRHHPVKSHSRNYRKAQFYSISPCLVDLTAVKKRRLEVFYLVRPKHARYPCCALHNACAHTSRRYINLKCSIIIAKKNQKVNRICIASSIYLC